MKIVIPPLNEQKRIASLLARADRLRQLRSTAHDLGDALLQSVFLEMFGNPVRNEKGWEKDYLQNFTTNDQEPGTKELKNYFTNIWKTFPIKLIILQPF